jgi:hypothetical protein
MNSLRCNERSILYSSSGRFPEVWGGVRDCFTQEDNYCG